LNGPIVISSIGNNNVAALNANASLKVTGSITGVAGSMAQPSSIVCSGGASTYSYALVGVDGNGGQVAGTAANSGATCTNPLSGGNPATINIPLNSTTEQQYQQFVRIDVYRTAGPMATGKIGSLTCTTPTGSIGPTCSAFSDTGLAASGTLPSINDTGSVGAPLYKTATACAASGTAANPSVVSCSAAPAGIIYCDVAASAGTCTVNTTAVTTNSTILITPSAADGTLLSKTCNTALTFGTAPLLAAKVAATSFTINMPTVATNGVCFEYTIIN
jgi:hypothetical protein